MTDITEYEIKFYPVDKEEYRKRLQNIGARLMIPERKMIRLVADYRDNPNFRNKECIRVRDEGNVIHLSFKSFVNNATLVSDQKEIETEVKDFDKTVNILERIGLKFNRRQENFREEWDFEGVQITIDTWPSLEPYTEIEGSSEEEIKKVSNLLGFDWGKKIIMPISGVYAMVYGVPDKEALEATSNISFDNLPFEGKEKKK